MNDKKWFILSALGPDKTGIVDEVSRFLYESNCNIEESRMAVLGGEFAIILLASGLPEDVQNLGNKKEELEKQVGLSVNFKITDDPEISKIEKRIPYSLSATSLDHPGIVYKISHFLKQFEINIAEVETESYNAPFGGTPMFHLEMVIQVPVSLSLHDLRNKLNEICERENIDLEINPVKI